MKNFQTKKKELKSITIFSPDARIHRWPLSSYLQAHFPTNVHKKKFNSQPNNSPIQTNKDKRKDA